MKTRSWIYIAIGVVVLYFLYTEFKQAEAAAASGTPSTSGPFSGVFNSLLGVGAQSAANGVSSIFSGLTGGGSSSSSTGGSGGSGDEDDYGDDE
jgi:hypothetical protein